MKKIIALLLFVPLIFSGCRDSPEKKAEKLIKKDREESLIKYEPVSFGILELSGQNYGRDSLRLIEVESLYKEIKKEYDNEAVLYGGTTRLSHLGRQMKDLFNEKLDLIHKTKEKPGLKLNHVYRSTPDSGGIVLDTLTFIFDKDVTKILSYYPHDSPFIYEGK